MVPNSASVRTGRVSAVNYKTGMIRVTYPDRDDMVTQEIPLQSFEYNMPSIGDMVQVNHLSNGAEMGVVMSNFWHDDNVPFEGKEGLWRKELSKTKNRAIMRYAEDEQSEFTGKFPKLKILVYEDEFNMEVAKDINVKGNQTISIDAQTEIILSVGGSSISIQNGQITINADSVNIKGSSLTVDAATTFNKSVILNAGITGDNV